MSNSTPETQKAIANFCGAASCQHYIDNTCPFDLSVQHMIASLGKWCSDGVFNGNRVTFLEDPKTRVLTFIKN